MATQPFNRPVTEEIPISISPGSMLLGVTADKRFVAFSVESLPAGGVGVPNTSDATLAYLNNVSAFLRAKTSELSAL